MNFLLDFLEYARSKRQAISSDYIYVYGLTICAQFGVLTKTAFISLYLENTVLICCSFLMSAFSSVTPFGMACLCPDSRLSMTTRL